MSEVAQKYPAILKSEDGNLIKEYLRTKSLKRFALKMKQRGQKAA